MVTNRINIYICESCPFFNHKDNGYCKLVDKHVSGESKCIYIDEGLVMDKKKALLILHNYQKWRRGYGKKMIPSMIIGYALDFAIKSIRKKIK